MPIKAVKEHIHDHFSNNIISKHLNHHFINITEIKLENEYSKLSFKQFNFKDIDKCTRLFKEVFSDYPWYDDWVSEDQARNYLIELIENPVFKGFIVYKSKEIAAVCFGHTRSWWMGKEFFIDEFFVSPKIQGNGIGTKLMDFVKNSLKEESYKRLVLLTNKDIPAEDFYIKNSFYAKKNRISMVNEL
ncbi:GNAT family N-acetyltransferase [Methanobacterium sp. ACI-7]|uniref:GNAT family N-acetyltransferase n=1 Tax=unclassified Methanobacterium TaxID=2627676 RepID=UPI0039C08F4A